MEDIRIQISGHPQEPNIDRFLEVNTVVHKLKESPQNATVIFDIVYEKAGAPMKDMDSKQRQFALSNANFVNAANGMKIIPDVVEDGIPYMFNLDADGNKTLDKTPIANTAKQYDFFKTIVNNKIKTENELIIQYVSMMDAVNFFD